jgi:hypothetical protein
MCELRPQLFKWLHHLWIVHVGIINIERVIATLQYSVVKQYV